MADNTPVSLAGLMIAKGGPLEKEDFLQYVGYDIDEYKDLIFNDEEAKKITNYLKKVSTGSSQLIPLHCAGPQCPIASRCPLQQMGKSPIGKSCLIEVTLLKEWITRYFQEYEVEPNNFTEIGYCNELAEIEVLLSRINLIMSMPNNSAFVIDQTTGFSNAGVPIVQTQVSPYFDVKDRLINRKSKIIKLMVGDRQEKYKKEAALKQRNTTDPSSKMAMMRRKIESLNKNLENLSLPQPDADQAKVLEEHKERLVEILTPDAILSSVE